MALLEIFDKENDPIDLETFNKYRADPNYRILRKTQIGPNIRLVSEWLGVNVERERGRKSKIFRICMYERSRHRMNEPIEQNHFISGLWFYHDVASVQAMHNDYVNGFNDELYIKQELPVAQTD